MYILFITIFKSLFMSSCQVMEEASVKIKNVTRREAVSIKCCTKLNVTGPPNSTLYKCKFDKVFVNFLVQLLLQRTGFEDES